MSQWSGKEICWFLHNANNVALTGISILPLLLNNSFSSQKMFTALRTICNFLLSKLLWFSEIHCNWDMYNWLLSTKGFFKVSFFNTFFFRLFTNLLTHEVTLNSFCIELNLLISTTVSTHLNQLFLVSKYEKAKSKAFFISLKSVCANERVLQRYHNEKK